MNIQTKKTTLEPENSAGSPPLIFLTCFSFVEGGGGGGKDGLNLYPTIFILYFFHLQLVIFSGGIERDQ